MLQIREPDLGCPHGLAAESPRPIEGAHRAWDCQAGARRHRREFRRFGRQVATGCTNEATTDLKSIGRAVTRRIASDWECTVCCRIGDVHAH